MKKLLIVANVSKEHIRKFHIPFIKRMRERGWQVDVACNIDENIPEADNAYHLPCNRNPFRGGLVKSIFKLRKIILKNNYDVVHCHTVTGSIVGRVAAISSRKRGTKVFYTNHGLHYFEGAPLKRWIVGYPMEKILAPYTDVFITINEADYLMVKKTLNVHGEIEKIHGIGVDLNKFRNIGYDYDPIIYRKSLSISANDFVLIYVAELIPNKNQKALINVVEELLPKIPHLKLLLVGPDHENGFLQKITHEKGLDDNIMFLGWRNDIPELLTMSDVYVASSKSEGLGLNVIEAMACGVPVVAFRNRGHCEIISNKENGFLVPQGDIRTFVQILDKIYENRWIREKIALNAYESINKYEVESVLKELVTIYEKVI